MISIRKYLDSVAAHPGPTEVQQEEPDPGSALAAYRAALAAMGIHGQRAVPTLGAMIETSLTGIGHNLTRSASPEAISDSRRLVEEQLSQWADKAQQNQKEGEETIRKLLQVVFEATESSGVRDEKFSREIVTLSDRLRTVAGLESLPLIRRSITENASALTDCVARMADEGRESVRRLTSQIAECQTRLLASERRALLDSLTGLGNRRGFEQQLETRIASGQPFSLLVADLNDFKIANDRYGHLAGDEILRQFADELKAQFLPQDTVTRWGGDEFVAIVAGSPQEGVDRLDRIRHWVLGDYKIAIDNLTTTVAVDAALGVAAWNGTESGQELFSRADREMYRAKEQSRQPV
jgi:diguanylate cyclase (GGDEF)-like protein